MDIPEFPIEKPNQRRAEITAKTESRLRRYVPPEPATIPAQSYDSLLDYWHILFRHRVTLLTITLASLCLALLISLVQTPIYRVRTSLEIQSASLMELKGNDPSGSNAGYASPESYVETQVKLLQSESLIEDVVDKMKLQKQRPATAWGRCSAFFQHLFAFSREGRLPEKERLVHEVEKNLTVRSSGNSRLLEILYESPDPKQAADLANTLVSDFIEMTQEERWKAAQGSAEWLTSHLDQMKGQLEASEAQLQDYARTTGLSITAEKESLAEALLKELQEELSKAQAERIADQARVEDARRKAADSLPAIQEDPTMREYRQKLTELQRQYAELSATLTPEHYKVQRVQAQINELQTQIQKERGNVVGRMRNEYATAARREQLLLAARNEQQKVVAEQSSKAIHYDTLKRDVDSNRHLYEVMLQRVKEASLAAAMRDSNVMVVDRARPPMLPYRPSLVMNSAIGLFGGMFLGFGFVLIRERYDRRISVPGDAHIYLDLPELGVIPLDAAIPLQNTNRMRLGHAVPSRTAAGGRLPSRPEGPELATWKRKPSLIAECVRTTLTSILLPSQDSVLPQVVVFTSPCPGDGKTTVACNLSIAVAEIGKKVLLIDGDLRRPRLHKVFSTTNTWGLSDILWSDNQLDCVPLTQLVRPTEVTGLSVLSGGSCGVTPTNLFYSPRMSKLIERLRSEFDMILIDAPPMIHLADARVLGRLADGVILVVRSGQTTTESARFAIQRFADDGTRVLGTVLNSWDPKTTGTYGYGSYGAYSEYAPQ